LSVARENVDVVRQVVELFESGGPEVIAPLLDSGIEIQPPPQAPEAGVYRGRSAALQRLAAISEPFSEIHVRVDEITALDDQRVLAVVRVSARGRSSDIPLETQLVGLIRLRSGKLLQLRAFLDRDEALHQASSA